MKQEIGKVLLNLKVMHDKESKQKKNEKEIKKDHREDQRQERKTEQ